MFTFDISPIIFSLGGFELRWYRVMVVMAILSVVLITSKEARRVGVPQEHIYSLALWAVVSGLLVARVVHVIDLWDYYKTNPSQIIGFGGLAIYGGVIGAVLAMVIYARVKRLSFWQLGDAVAPGAIFGQAIGRIGCVFDGCCYGLPTTLPWGFTYIDPSSYAPLGVSVHPTQVYLLLWDLIVFSVLWILRTRTRPVGTLFLLYLSAYAAGDFSIRFLREGSDFLWGFQEAQVIGLVMLIVALPLMIVRMLRAKATSNPVSFSETAPDQED